MDMGEKSNTHITNYCLSYFFQKVEVEAVKESFNGKECNQCKGENRQIIGRFLKEYLIK